MSLLSQHLPKFVTEPKLEIPIIYAPEMERPILSAIEHVQLTWAAPTESSEKLRWSHSIQTPGNAGQSVLLSTKSDSMMQSHFSRQDYHPLLPMESDQKEARPEQQII